MHNPLPLSIFDAATPQADRLNLLTNYFIVAALGVLGLVIGLLIYITLKFRAKPAHVEPQQTLGNLKLETAMIAVPFVLVAIFLYLGIGTMQAVLPPADSRQPDVVLTGHQFWWEARYPAPNGSATNTAGVTTANEIHLPAGKTLLLQLRAADVIHDWWVPAFGPKMDMIPGRTNHLWVTIKQPGTYEGVCSEFCGTQHAWMRIKVITHTPAGYQQWLRASQIDAQKPVGQSALAGAALFGRSTCGNCHAIGGTKANGHVGPNLTHLASRSTMLAGMLPTTKANLRQWITDPQALKPGALMPKYMFSPDSLTMLVDYLAGLK